jgi:hypothetical protein
MIAISNIKLGLERLSQQAALSSNVVTVDVIEPLDHFQKSFTASAQDTIQ